MPTSTRIFLALTALIVVVLVIYYGLFSGEGAPQTARATEEPAHQPEPPAPAPKPGQSIIPRQRTDAPPRVEPQEPQEPPEVDPQPAPIEDHPPINLDTAEEIPAGKDAPTIDSEGEATDEPDPETDPDPEPEPDPEPQQPEPDDRPAPPQYTEYTVKQGDTMTTIAEQWFGDASKWDLIAKANPLVDPVRLRVGQVLRLPPKDAQREDPDEAAGDKPIEYTVRPGDTLSKIARMYYGHERHWRIIHDANRSTIGDNPNNLHVGMKLTIPPAPSE